jgi:acyl carrier protein
LTINWGPWSEVGMAAKMNERQTGRWHSHGISSINPSQGLTILRAVIGQSQITQMAVLPIDGSVWMQRNFSLSNLPIINNLITNSSSPAPNIGSVSAAERLQQAPPNERRGTIIELIGETAQDIFGLDRVRRIPADQNLASLGMDSMLAIQLSNRLKVRFGVVVPSTLAFQCPTIEAIADYLLAALNTIDGRNHLSRDEATHVSTARQLLDKAPSPKSAEALLANMDQLSDREVEILLHAVEFRKDSN